MVNLTFGEQVKIILSRKGMTIKELAELVEKHTGKPMSRQNMTQKLGRDNFQEQDMRLIAQILGCKFTLSIMEMEEVSNVRDITVGELVDMAEETELPQIEEIPEEIPKETPEETPVKQVDEREREILRKGISGYFKKSSTVKSENAEKADLHEASEKIEEPILGEINPYTRKEYKNNSVRMHPKRIGYVQVYDAERHQWTEMTEWAFLGYQERKKLLQGKDYEPPIYLD